MNHHKVKDSEGESPTRGHSELHVQLQEKVCELKYVFPPN